MLAASHYFMYPNGPFLYLSDDDINDNSDDEGPSPKSKSKGKEPTLPADPREHPFGHPAESSARAKIRGEPRRAEVDDMMHSRLFLTSDLENPKAHVRASTLREMDRLRRNERELNSIINVGGDIISGSVKQELFVKAVQDGDSGCIALDISSIRTLLQTMRDIALANPVDMEALRDLFDDYRQELAVKLSALHELAILLADQPNDP